MPSRENGVLLKNENTIFEIASEQDFLAQSLYTFRFQYKNNEVYRQWVQGLKKDPERVVTLSDIPFLPIETFKRFEVLSAEKENNTLTFLSSATTSAIRARHLVVKPELYEYSFLKTFTQVYGAPADSCILALLPNYLQQSASSLVYMCDRLIRESGHPDSGFFLDNINDLKEKIRRLNNSETRVFLIGVSYALMDLSDQQVTLGKNITVIETGGMKGRRKELLKAELHAYLKAGFQTQAIHSEYGMTELLSQAYSVGDGIFKSPPWLRFLTREVEDPLQLRHDSRTGGINVIDLANLYSCSFIATKDLGRVYPDGSLELMGRYDISDVRGCNLMIENF